MVNLLGNYVLYTYIYSEILNLIRNTSFCRCFADALYSQKENSQFTDHSLVCTDARSHRAVQNTEQVQAAFTSFKLLKQLSSLALINIGIHVNIVNLKSMNLC